MVGTFRARMPVLHDLIGRGEHKAEIVVDQVYAGYQHFRTDLRHPRGGNAYYLTLPFDQGRTQLQAVADGMLVSGTVRALAAGTEKVSALVEPQTPILTGLLRGSRTVVVSTDGTAVVTVPARYPRLSPEALKEWQRTHEIRGTGRAGNARRPTTRRRSPIPR